jgi:hypothetical protein
MEITTKTMSTKNIFGFLIATIALVSILVTLTSAMDCGDSFACITDVTVDGISHYDGESAAVFAGDTIGVRVTFTANEIIGNPDTDDDFEEDVRIIARILGEPGLSEVTERFDVIEGKTYSRLLNIALPFDLDELLNEPFVLEVSIESNNEEADSVSIFLEVQRENELIEILAIESEDEVQAGETLALDVIVKNRGRDEAEDTIVRASIPALGISKMAFLGDLSPFDQSHPDKEDSGFVRVFLNIPKGVTPGVYNVEIEAFDDDSTTLATRKIVIVGAGMNSNVITSSTSKTFAVGESKEYTITIVNAGNSIKIYELVLETTGDLLIDLDESVVAVPAGSSKTVKMTVTSNKEGTFNFAVNVHSEGELVEKQNFVANVEGKKAAGNAALVLTVILAIIFIVLLIVLIVLLTRKPEKTEEFGESYY